MRPYVCECTDVYTHAGCSFSGFFTLDRRLLDVFGENVAYRWDQMPLLSSISSSVVGASLSDDTTGTVFRQK